MPIPELMISTRPKSPSANDPVIKIMTNSDPRIALNRVNTLVRTIVHSDRDDVSLVVLTWPRARRSATSAVLRPPAGGVEVTRVTGLLCQPDRTSATLIGPPEAGRRAPWS